MKEKQKKYRDSAKLAVFSHMGSAVFGVIMSGIVATLIIYYYRVTAIEMNVNVFSTDPKVMKMTLLVNLLSTLINMPVSFCASRYYLKLSRSSMYEKVRFREFFAPFTDPAFLVKGTVTVFLTTVLSALGVFILFFPVYFTFCMAVFVLCDDPKISPVKALARSFKLMKGNKWTAFCTVLPILALEVFLVLAMRSFFFSLILYLVEAVFYVTLAIIYCDLKQKLSQ